VPCSAHLVEHRALPRNHITSDGPSTVSASNNSSRGSQTPTVHAQAKQPSDGNRDPSQLHDARAGKSAQGPYICPARSVRHVQCFSFCQAIFNLVSGMHRSLYNAFVNSVSSRRSIINPLASIYAQSKNRSSLRLPGMRFRRCRRTRSSRAVGEP